MSHIFPESPKLRWLSFTLGFNLSWKTHIFRSGNSGVLFIILDFSFLETNASLREVGRAHRNWATQGKGRFLLPRRRADRKCRGWVSPHLGILPGWLVVLSSCEDRGHCWWCSHLLAHFLVGNPHFLALLPIIPSWSFSVDPWRFWKFSVCCNVMLLLF